MTYAIEIRPAAFRALKRIDPQYRKRIQTAITMLGRDPRPPASKKLRGRDGYRVRVGDYCILYTIDDGKLIIVVVTLGHRRDVYDR